MAKPNKLPRMIVDYHMCLRVQDGEELLAEPHIQYKCPVCELYSGKSWPVSLPPPVCEDHDDPVRMEKLHD